MYKYLLPWILNIVSEYFLINKEQSLKTVVLKWMMQYNCKHDFWLWYSNKQQ